MRKINVVLMLFIVVLTVPTLLMGQKFKKMDEVEYLQLPNEEPIYNNVEVFVTLDQSQTRDALSFGMGKLSGGNAQKGSTIDSFIQKVFSDQTEKYEEWYLFEDFQLKEVEKKLTVILTYLPDDSARPMMAPMKDKDGLFTFSYRVNSSMKVYDGDKLLLEKEFAAISGMGHSKTWDEGSKKMIQIEEKDDIGLPPYEAACRDGVVNYAKRVIYGMYGVKKLTAQLGVAEIKKDKGSTAIQKKFNELISSKKGLILSKDEIKTAKECISYWESILPKTKKDYLWAVHYNLAIAYGWILDATKSKEHIAKVEELNKEIFDRIKNKSGAFTSKHLNILEAYNNGKPFCEYYAQGINNYPDVVKMMEIDAYTISHALSINTAIAGVFDIPVALPIFPYERKVNMKKCEGTISYKGKPLSSFKYELEKGKLLSISLKGDQNSPYKKFKESTHITYKKTFIRQNKKEFIIR